MKYVLYGLPCAGKTTLLSKLSMPTMQGGEELNKMASGRFNAIPDDEKMKLRIKYAEQLEKRTDSFVSDGHYSFLDDVVFTEADGELYDVFLYLYCKPEIIAERLKFSKKNSRFAELSSERIRKWQTFEIEMLRSECHDRNKDFYVIRDLTSEYLQHFINRIEDGFSSYKLAANIADNIIRIYPDPCELYICDGDKTIIEQDSFRVCTDNYVTHVFDDNCYTGYQSLLFSEETDILDYDMEKLSSICLNKVVYSRIEDKNYVVLSSGLTKLWDKLAIRLGLRNVIADTMISADTKYFVVKILQNKGYSVIAFGDGKNDYYMLKQADKGYLYIGSYLSRSLRETDTSGIRLLYDKSPFILSDKNTEIAEDIQICKSDSGVNGARLAFAHIRLGKLLGENIRNIIPNQGSAVITLERGGRFFGDGVYTGFGGVFYSYNAQKDYFPAMNHSVTLIVDSVINTGRSILEMIDVLKQRNPDTEIIIVTNVIQEKALELLKEYKIFTIRTSSNSFVGRRQAVQKDGIGPDTADRLFNYIK